MFCCGQSAIAQNTYVDSLKNWIRIHPKIDSQYILTLHRISYRLSEKDIRQSFTYYERVSTISDSLNFAYGKSLAQINLALLLYNSANYDASNAANFKAIDYADSCGSLRLKAVALNNIGETFSILREFEKCRNYTYRAIELNKKLNAWRGVAVNYELLQQCDLKEKLFASAKKHLDTGMTYAVKANESLILSLYYLGFGKLKAINHQKDSALFYFNKAMSLSRPQRDEKNRYYIYVAESEYLKDIAPKKKIILLDSAYSIARRIGFVEGIAHSAELLSSTYDIMKNKDSALAYFHIYKAAYDSVFSENIKRNVIIMESDRLIKQKEVENRHLHELAKLQERDLVFKNALLLAALVLLLLMVAIAFFINKNIQSKKNRSESELQQKIAEVKMRSLRSQMNPHFIFNSLNSIENFMMRNDKNAAIEYLNKFSTLIRIILNSSRAELYPFIKDFEGIQLYVELEQLRFNKKFSFTTHVDPELLNGDYKVPSLLIQPYVENAIIHGLAQSEAHPLELKLCAVLQNDHIIYTIEDNGIGRQQSQKYKEINKPAYKSLGLELTQERIDIFNQIKKTEGKVEIDDLYDEHRKPLGTRVRLKIRTM